MCVATHCRSHGRPCKDGNKSDQVADSIGGQTKLDSYARLKPKGASVKLRTPRSPRVQNGQDTWCMLGFRQAQHV